MTIADVAQACLDLADYIDRSGAASSRFLRHVAGCLRYVPRANAQHHRAMQLCGTILGGRATALELQAFAKALEAA